jgi:hypothetical protein
VEEDEEEDPEESKAETGTISKGGTRETVGWFVTANRYEFEDERVFGTLVPAANLAESSFRGRLFFLVSSKDRR